MDADDNVRPACGGGVHSAAGDRDVAAGILRRCRYPDCQAVFLANRRQRYCELHQDEARRLRYRTASVTYYRKKHRAARRRTRRPVVAGHR
jgi:hypothetical protein